MNKERLLKLAALLDTVPDDKFDMGAWGTSARPIAKTPRCVTAACALGWATAIPEFHAEGLQLFAYPGETQAFVEYQAHLDEEAGARFFGLTSAETCRLFLSGFDMTAKEKAEEIRELVAAS